MRQSTIFVRLHFLIGCALCDVLYIYNGRLSSGLRSYLSQQDIEDAKVVVVANLKARNMRGRHTRRSALFPVTYVDNICFIASPALQS